ncbi:Ubiquinol-cytochrome c reductase iron-sulfur subunit [Roseovarius sp. THAF9]|uniref:ubiquinol-cytochrome c reductase iron-sulfur subunit n=1 Tax=Roseovarius sp. THAF9 TaxID=2587847 RepID=UPI0012692FD3|nr:ubiquinol-cytochrome c reductase iron-sulfur subunit [Roseovarius sp. THAF9]QFT91823.1 Ubiquinol-cytochrome c reductase iron-sulfur subunit [Roseovarius sp. THAF9]
MDARRRSFLYYLTAGAGAVTLAAGATGLFRATGTTADIVATRESLRLPLTDIPEGDTRTYKISGRPLLIWHRNADQTERALSQDILKDWRDRRPERGGSGQLLLPYDRNRTIDHEWLAIWNVCPRFGCVPLAQHGDFGGFFCPCGSSHFDMAGRIRKGPALSNMRTVPARISDDRQYIDVFQAFGLTTPPR